MANPSNMEPSNLSLETPRATIPDIYVGFSPSFSTHFLTSSNIALPYPQDSFPLSPTLQYRSNLFDYYGTRFNLSSPSSPTSPLFSSLFHKVKKGRHRLTVEEFNAFPNSKKRSTTSERSAVPSPPRLAPPVFPARRFATWIRSLPTFHSTVSSPHRCDCSTD